MAYSLEIEGLVAHKHKLEAEIERLRTALDSIIKCGGNYGLAEAAEIARAALAAAKVNHD